MTDPTPPDHDRVRPIDLPPERPIETFRRQMKEVRKRQGLSQAALASRVQDLGGTLSDTAIVRIEGGNRDVSLEEALILAAALRVAPVHLIVPIDNRAVRIVDTLDAYLYPALKWAIGEQRLGSGFLVPLTDGAPGESPTRELGSERGTKLELDERTTKVFDAIDDLFPEDPIFDEWRPEQERVIRRNHLYQLGKVMLDEIGAAIYGAELSSRRHDPSESEVNRRSERQAKRLQRLQVRLRNLVEELNLYLDDAGALSGTASSTTTAAGGFSPASAKGEEEHRAGR